MTSPLLTFLNGNMGGKLCDQGDLCSDLGVPSGPDKFQSFSFEGLDQNALPPFEVSTLAPLSHPLPSLPPFSVPSPSFEIIEGDGYGLAKEQQDMKPHSTS